MGKKNLLARSASKPGAKLCGFTDSLSVLNYAPKATRSFTLITQPKIITPLFNIKQMGASFFRAYLMCELVLRAAEFDDKMSQVYDALKNSLIIMDLMTADDQAASDKVLIKFMLFFLEYAGFSLNFDNCCHCAKQPGETIIYDADAGGACCVRCAIGRKNAFDISGTAGLIAGLNKEADLEKIIKTSYSPNKTGEVVSLLKSHIKANLNIALNSGQGFI